MTLATLKILQPSANERVSSPADSFCCTVEAFSYQTLCSKYVFIERLHTCATHEYYEVVIWKWIMTLEVRLCQIVSHYFSDVVFMR